MIRVYLSAKQSGGRCGADVVRDVLRVIVKSLRVFHNFFERVIAGVMVSATVMSGDERCRRSP